MSSDDLTLRILVDIRDEVRTTREQLDLRMDQVEHRLGERIDRLGDRIDGLDNKFDGLEHRLTESEIRTATELKGLAGTLQDIKDLFRDRLDLRDRVTRCEHDIGELKHRIG